MVLAIDSNKFGKIIMGLGDKLFKQIINRATVKLEYTTEISKKVYETFDQSQIMTPIMKYAHK